MEDEMKVKGQGCTWKKKREKAEKGGSLEAKRLRMFDILCLFGVQHLCSLDHSDIQLNSPRALFHLSLTAGLFFLKRTP
jgi:hypothetical protein